MFTLRNLGGAELTGLAITLQGASRADFSVTAPPATSVQPGQSTSFTISFAPLAPGLRTVSLQIASNDGDEHPFDIVLTGRSLDPQGDDDNDGVSNGVEINLAALGFDPSVDSSHLRTLLHENRHGLGLYRATDMQTLAVGQPVIEKDRTTGKFQLTLGIEKSSDLRSWNGLTGFSPSYDAATGRIHIELTPDTSAVQFYRILGTKP
jgi:hypothetical protein